VRCVIMYKICEVCREPISDKERWFRVREEYVHLFVLREIFEAGLGEAAASKGGSGDAGA
jgi:hypothetical protein